MIKRRPVPFPLVCPILLVCLAADARPSPVPALPDPPLKSVRLVVLDAGNPGPATVGFHVELEAGWHLYWVDPGDAGLAPNARWTLPPGFEAGPLRHPVPKKTVGSGVVSLEHEGPVLLLCEIVPPPTGWPAGPWKAAAVLEWMACRESCVIGETAVEATFPADAAALAESRSLYETFAPRFPRPLAGSGVTAGSARAEWTGSAWRVEVPLSGPRAGEAGEFFAYPVEGFVVDNAAVTSRDGRIVCPYTPSKGPGSPPPTSVSGVLVVAGAGYELSIAVPRQKTGRSAESTPLESRLFHPSLPGLISNVFWR